MSDKRPTLTVNLNTAAPNPARIARPAAKAGRASPNKHAWADAALREALAQSETGPA